MRQTGKKAQSTSSFVDISGEGFAKPCYDTSAKMLWDDNYLYVGAVLQEDDIKAKTQSAGYDYLL